MYLSRAKNICGACFYDQGGMPDKKIMIACILGRQEHMVGEDGSHDPFHNVVRETFRDAGFGVLPMFIGWHVPYISQEKRE